MKTITSKNYEYFICATKHMIKHGGINGGKLLQKDFANALACTPEHLSGILSPKRVRKASAGLQEKIAAHFDMPLIGFLDVGRTIYEGGEPPKTPHLDPEKMETNVSLKKHYDDHDIVTQVSRIVNKLHDAENEIHRLNSLVEAIGVAVTIIGNDEMVIYQNSKSRDLFGQNFVGQPYRQTMALVKKKFVEGKMSAVEKCFDSGIVENSIWWAGEKCISSTASVLRDNAGQAFGVVCIAKDITNRQKLMEDNKALVAFFEEAINLMERGVLIYDQHRNIIFTNKMYRDQIGMTGNEEIVDEIFKLLGKKGVRNLSEINTAMVESYMDQKEKSVVCEFENGKKFIQTTKPISNPDGTFAGMIAIISPDK